MAYLKRNIENILPKIRMSYPEIYVGGQRQVGKSTMIRMIMGSEYRFVNLRDIEDRTLALSNPRLFFEMHRPPVFIDEIHLAPNLLDTMMTLSDLYAFENLQRDRQKSNLFFLSSSSSQLHGIRGINESSAGRVAVLEMSGISLQERNGVDFGAFTPTLSLLTKRNAKHRTKEEIYQIIFEGGMPKIVIDKVDRDLYYSSYLDSYINKDLRELANLRKGDDFYRFLRFLAARTAQTIDYTAISKAIGVSVLTIREWFALLESTGIIKLLAPFMANISNRIIKAKKMYFMDTGLCLYLLGFSDWRPVMNNSLISGSIFETFIVSEIIKSFLNQGKTYEDKLFYYRDTSQREIDLLMFDGVSLTPIEIKKSDAAPKPDKNFHVLSVYGLPIEMGWILSNVDRIRPINDHVWEFPVSLI